MRTKLGQLTKTEGSNSSSFRFEQLAEFFSLPNSRFGLLTGRNTVYSELKGQASTTAESGVTVQSADGFVVEHYSRVRNAFCCHFHSAILT